MKERKERKKRKEKKKMRKRKGKEGNFSESVVICSTISNSFIWYNQYLSVPKENI